ncbi:MAG: vitamin B12-dependent ribonucleotide reductase, partial [Deltaproteobacteria bacterium]|nr:vitamin B12-dependent ribonucleotide reductase [Deltaproteobacteria bacterium]
MENKTGTIMEEVVNTAPAALDFQRFFTVEGVSPFDTVKWDKRDVEIVNENKEVVFKQEGVLFPSFYSHTAGVVVASKYFRGLLGTPERENSMKQLVSRVANTITLWGVKDGYFTEESARIFNDELTHLLLYQYASFNSPVWFNVGVEKNPQCSACFINSITDTMESILELAKTEGMLFKYGSGTP